MSGMLGGLQGFASNLGGKFTSILNRIVPPEQRAEIVAKLQNFAINNPKLAAFLTTQIVLTGFPLLLFITFTITVFLFSLIAALLIGLIAAVLFTVFMVLVALVVILPTVFMTTFAASFIFLWGLGGYYLLKWLNDGDAPAPEGTAIGDKLNSWTGGRMSWLTDGARKKQEDIHTGVDKTPKVLGNEENGKAKPSAKSSGAEHGEEKDGGKEHETNHSNGTHKRPPKLASGSGHDAASAAKDTARGGPE